MMGHMERRGLERVWEMARERMDQLTKPPLSLGFWRKSPCA
jgi:hypothetical protein